MAEKPAPATKKPKSQYGPAPKPLVGIIGLALFVTGVAWMIKEAMKPKKKKKKVRGH